MTRVALLVLVVLSFVAAFAGPLTDDSSLVGVWRAKMGSLPFLTITVEEDGGKLRGAVLFYLIRRNGNGPPTASPGVPEPLIDPSFDGKTLTYKVSHRYAHPPRTLHDPPVAFRLEITGANKGMLFAPEGLSVEMVRDTY